MSGEMVFVGMPFGDDRNPAFKRRCDAVFQAIEDVCEELELDACRVDQFAGSNSIIRQIKRLIRDSHFCIFDLTGERPNVYYELGYAHRDGHDGNTVVFIAERGTALHFDIAHRATQFFSDTEELRDILREHLAAMVEDIED